MKTVCFQNFEYLLVDIFLRYLLFKLHNIKFKNQV